MATAGPRRSCSGWRYSPRLVALRAPRGSPCSRASSGACSWAQGGRGSPETGSWRRPEFGHVRGWGCGALGEKLMVQTASAGHQKRAGATGSSRGAQVRRATRPWRTAVLGNVGGGATARERAKRRRGNGVELTASSSAVSLGSGTGCGRHIGDGDRRCPRLKMMSMAAIRRVPGCLARRGGVEGEGGALGHVRGVRGRRWSRQQQAAATGSAR